MPCSSTILPRTRREQRPRKDRYQFHFKHQHCVQSLALAHSLVGREPWLGRAGRSQASFSRMFEGEGVWLFRVFEDRCISYIEHDNKPIKIADVTNIPIELSLVFGSSSPFRHSVILLCGMEKISVLL